MPALWFCGHLDIAGQNTSPCSRSVTESLLPLLELVKLLSDPRKQSMLLIFHSRH